VSDNDPVVLDSLAFIHLARGDKYGEELDRRFKLRERTVAPTMSVASIGEVMRIVGRITSLHKFEEAPLDEVRRLLGEMNIAEISSGIAKAYGKIRAFCDDGNTTFASELAWVAATAKVHGAAVITHHSDFKKVESLVQCHVVDRMKFLKP
jgi:predicted nucleic acid-binding protein